MVSEMKGDECPYCAETIADLHEISRDDFEMDCPHCDQPIAGTRTTAITYELSKRGDEDEDDDAK